MNHNGKEYKLLESCHGRAGSEKLSLLEVGDVIVTKTDMLTFKEEGFIWWANHDETYLFDSWQSEDEVAFTEPDMIAILWSGVEIYRENKARVFLMLNSGVQYYYNSELDRVEWYDSEEEEDYVKAHSSLWPEIIRLKKKCGELPQ